MKTTVQSRAIDHEAPPPSKDKNVDSTLNLKKKLSQKSILDYMSHVDWVGQGNSLAPFVVELDPTTACNLACPDCISRELLNQGYFSRKRLHDLAHELVEAGVKAVVLIGGGEPLAHPEIGWLIEYFAKSDVKLGLTTNGTLLDRHLDLIAEAVDWTRVSIDAATAATFQQLRPSPSGKSLFPKVINNMRQFAAKKRGKLGYSFMIYCDGLYSKAPEAGPKAANGKRIIPLQPAFANGVAGETKQSVTNVGEIYAAAGLAKDIGCDYFELKPMYDENHFLILMNQEITQLASQAAEQAIRLETDSFKVLLATKLPDFFAHKSPTEPKPYHRCAVAQMRTLITPSGVYVCPYFRGRDDKRVGDVTKSEFKVVWQSAQRAEVMSKLDPARDCTMHCIRHESNLFVEDWVTGQIRPI